MLAKCLLWSFQIYHSKLVLCKSPIQQSPVERCYMQIEETVKLPYTLHRNKKTESRHWQNNKRKRNEVLLSVTKQFQWKCESITIPILNIRSDLQTTSKSNSKSNLNYLYDFSDYPSLFHELKQVKAEKICHQNHFLH